VRVPEPRLAAQAVAVAAVGVPAALIAHLLVTGSPAGATAGLAVTLAVLVVAAALPARTAAGLALVTAVTQLAAQTVLAVLPGTAPDGAPACIPAVGRAATLGVRLAVVHTDGACPSGTLAVADLAAAALAALGVAAAILAGNAALALLTGLLLGRALLAGEVLAALAGVLLQVLARTAALLGWAPPVPPGAVAVRRPPRATRLPAPNRWRPGAVARRGPPLPAALAP
jgi:hypothetical protein